MKIRRIGKKLWSLMLTLAMVLTMTVTALPVYAAAGGTISVTFNPEVTGLTGTTFNVYKVGTYGRDASGNSILVIDPVVKSSTGLDDSVLQGKETLVEWLGAASTIAQYEDKLTAVNNSPVTVNASDTSTDLVTVQENGIYLIVGSEEKAGDLYWKPVPVLVQVLNGNSNFTFNKEHADPSKVDTKMTSKPVIYTHNVKKVWNDNNNEKGARPASLDVEIMYGDKVIDTVTLNEDNNWNFTWTTTEATTASNPKKEYSTDQRTKKFNEEAYPDDGPYTYYLTDADMPSDGQPHTWSAREVFSTDNKLLYNYYNQEPPSTKITYKDKDGSMKEVTVGTVTSADGVTEHITLANSFDTKKLIITKTMQAFANIGENMNAPVVFEVTGYGRNAEGEDVEMYHTYTGLVFDMPGVDSVTLNNIPIHLTKLVVEEKYYENYKPVDNTPTKYEFESPTSQDGKTYEADFTNTHTPSDTPPKYTGSIVNKYSKGTDGKYTYEGYRGLPNLR